MLTRVAWCPSLLWDGVIHRYTISKHTSLEMRGGGATFIPSARDVWDMVTNRELAEENETANLCVVMCG